ncbi:hypothetical protein K7X08_031679 [Anisodus acutangulus]|uniref:ABC transporter domain-containing protein n=1 Tax=Anisodus acutangulus TaxID=402998 RepID=A0A9Q1MS56_9SOLA|nr:hypothetical protein K7X08_031679 [Anisodus acutangulus]
MAMKMQRGFSLFWQQTVGKDWLNLEKDQLFRLLGPNGAGKTTVISCLTGITPVTRGNALIYGNSIRSSVGISNRRKLIGVCSQHLELFATIKGLSPTSKRSEAKKLLADVKLDDVAKVRAGSYSDGIKRRLSLGIALIGDPKLLFLDEPVWILKVSNDVNAMANTVDSKHHEAVKEFFRQHINVTPKEEDKSFLTFVIPNEKEKLLENFFADQDNTKTEFGILNIQIGLTTLEEVFLNIARKAELEVAASEETIKTLILPSGTTLQVPLGSKYVEIPGTISTENPQDLMVEVFWEYDDHGNLCISGHSDEIPVPPNLQISTSILVIAKSRVTKGVSAKARQSSSKLLRYPLRSASKSKEEKPPLTDSSNSSALISVYLIQSVFS